MRKVNDSLRKKFARRLLILAILLPPFMGVTSISKDERPHLRQTPKQILIHGSKSYLDPNPSF
ncbi:MAG TPA: hypothetical protein PKC28_01150 [Bdellovibrionales bacterium]|nr:hypothetical protein [Bdellovibrionales bacterium]